MRARYWTGRCRPRGTCSRALGRSDEPAVHRLHRRFPARLPRRGSCTTFARQRPGLKLRSSHDADRESVRQPAPERPDRRRLCHPAAAHVRVGPERHPVPARAARRRAAEAHPLRHARRASTCGTLSGERFIYPCDRAGVGLFGADDVHVPACRLSAGGRSRGVAHRPHSSSWCEGGHGVTLTTAESFMQLVAIPSVVPVPLEDPEATIVTPARGVAWSRAPPGRCGLVPRHCAA